LTVGFADIPQPFEAGTAYDIDVLVRNIGEAAAGQFNVELAADGTFVGSVQVNGLAAGSSTTVTFTWTPQVAGDYTLRAIADPENAVAEENEANNEATALVTVAAPPYPWWIIGVVVIVVVVIAVVVAYLLRKRRL